MAASSDLDDGLHCCARGEPATSAQHGEPVGVSRDELERVGGFDCAVRAVDVDAQ